MINIDDVIKEETKEYNPNWPQIPDHPYRILTIEGSGSGKAILLFDLVSQQPDIDKIYLYAKDPSSKHQFFIYKRESTGSRHLNDSKAFIEYSNNMDIFKSIEQNNPNKKRKILMVFDDMIAEMISNKKFNSIVTEFLLEEES